MSIVCPRLLVNSLFNPISSYYIFLFLDLHSKTFKCQSKSWSKRGLAQNNPKIRCPFSELNKQGKKENRTDRWKVAVRAGLQSDPEWWGSWTYLPEKPLEPLVLHFQLPARQEVQLSPIEWYRLGSSLCDMKSKDLGVIGWHLFLWPLRVPFRLKALDGFVVVNVKWFKKKNPNQGFVLSFWSYFLSRLFKTRYP